LVQFFARAIAKGAEYSRGQIQAMKHIGVTISGQHRDDLFYSRKVGK